MQINFALEPLEYFEQSCRENKDFYSAAMQERNDVFNRSGDYASDNLADRCKLILLKWGGMNYRHYRMIENQTSWLKLAREISLGHLSRTRAYRAFFDLRLQGELKGMGPAYFTKLIYFLMPEESGTPRGYIMDQWVGCGINILTDSEIVVMDKTFSIKEKNSKPVQDSVFIVSDINTEQNYRYYCRAIETLADITGQTPDKTECLLMSKGGRKPFIWRHYVKEKRLPPSLPIL